MGTYLHGLFHNDRLRHTLLTGLAAKKRLPFHPSGGVVSKEEQYDRLAALVRSHLDMDLHYRTVDVK